MTRQTFFRKVRDTVLTGDSPLDVELPTGDLTPWTPSASNPWDERSILHFYGRLGFMPTQAEVQSALTRTPKDILRDAMDDNWCSTWLPAPLPGWEQWLYVQPYDGTGNDHKKWQDQEDLYQGGKFHTTLHWITMFAAPESFLREKLALFWHNHFVVSLAKLYYPKHYYEYIKTLRSNAWGNFKQFAKDITILPAMLIYLDGIYNEKDAINENYAREMMELFLVGRTDKDGNATYAQDDVRNIAYAVAGWNYWMQGPAPDIVPQYFAEYYFDFETKRSPLGADAKVYGLLAAKEFGVYTYLDDQIQADIVDLIFEKRAHEISRHITEKFYMAFVCNDTSSAQAQTIIDALARLLRDEDWDLKPMLQALFLSSHFFDRTFRGSLFKSPMDFMIGTLRHLDMDLPLESATNLFDISKDTMNQKLGWPPNVKGWPGYRAWLDSATLSARNLRFASVIAAGGTISDDRGSITWSDDAVLAWAQQFSTFGASLEEFVAQVLKKLIVFPFSDQDMSLFITRLGNNATSAWPALDDAQKVSIVRSVVGATFMLPHYQMC